MAAVKTDAEGAEEGVDKEESGVIALLASAGTTSRRAGGECVSTGVNSTGVNPSQGTDREHSTREREV